ncbi:hypothetical protein KCP76_01410 [Salmonella enterica subsp. enterica serovar Weltevreden]|nr:hypothetical protein KCP76_01410 [Salmonella enterica subsp. enterica serovar Weltevreden]
MTGHHTFTWPAGDWRNPDCMGFEGVGLVFTGSLILGPVMAFFPGVGPTLWRGGLPGTDATLRLVTSVPI